MKRRWLGLKDIMEELEINRKTAKKLLDEGQIEHHYFAGAYRVRAEEFEAWLETTRVTPGQPHDRGERERNLRAL